MKKTLKLVGRSWFLNLYIKTAMWTVTSSNNLITFKSLKRGLVCSKNLEKVMILMAFFCRSKITLIVKCQTKTYGDINDAVMI